MRRHLQSATENLKPQELELQAASKAQNPEGFWALGGVLAAMEQEQEQEGFGFLDKEQEPKTLSSRIHHDAGQQTSETSNPKP